MLVVEEDDAEPDDRDLGVDVHAAPEARRQRRPSRSVRASVSCLELVLLAVPAR